MAVIALLLSVVAVAFWLPGGNAACPSFNINYPPMRTLLCPGDIITYTCALSSSFGTITTQWTGSPGFQCSNPGSDPNTIQLQQSKTGSLNNVSVSCGILSAVMTNISGTCYTSVLTIPTPQYFNGTTVICRDGITSTLIGNDTLNIQLASPPSAPAGINVRNVSSNKFTVTWTSVPTATSYNVSINDSTPISLPPVTTIIVTIGNNNIMVSIPSTGAIFYVLNLTNRINSSVYNVSVVAINCAGSSSPAKITAMLSAASSPSGNLAAIMVAVLVNLAVLLM